MLKKGTVIEVRGFGIDNKKVTCQSYTIFDGDVDLEMCMTVCQLVREHAKLFSDWVQVTLNNCFF